MAAFLLQSYESQSRSYIRKKSMAVFIIMGQMYRLLLKLQIPFDKLKIFIHQRRSYLCLAKSSLCWVFVFKPAQPIYR